MPMPPVGLAEAQGVANGDLEPVHSNVHMHISCFCVEGHWDLHQDVALRLCSHTMTLAGLYLTYHLTVVVLKAQMKTLGNAGKGMDIQQ